MPATVAQSAAAVSAAESKLQKMMVRLAFGTPMIGAFFGLVCLGHPYLVLLVVFLQVGLFRELVNVRYVEREEKDIPLFRTLQWCMFALAMWQTYTRSFFKLGLVDNLSKKVPALASSLQSFARYRNFLTFSAYVAMFVGFVLTLRNKRIQYQIGNLVWTIAVLCLIVFQIAGTTKLIFAGLFWFMLPCGLVVANDCWAYFSGVAFGKKFIKAPFLAISPNKTWEGFIGAFFLTLIWAWLYSDWISRSESLICPQLELVAYAELQCAPSNLFKTQTISLPYDDYVLFTVEAKPVQLHALLLGAFASVVAPFGGFFASAIKRAYDIKDFDSFIPGHGGLMDRMDCHFLMLLCTYIHYETFIAESNLSIVQVERQIVNLFSLLPATHHSKMFDLLKTQVNAAGMAGNLRNEL